MIPTFLRYLRFLFRFPSNIINKLRLNIDLYINRVEHKGIICHGVPFIAVAKGGICRISDNFSMNNNLRFNPIGYPQPCMFVVTKGSILTIGENVGISQTSLICHHSITIGNNVKIGGGVKIYDTDFHSLNPEVRKNHSLDMKTKKVAPVVIQDNVFIGAGTIVLKGVTIGENSVVGAGSVVTKSIPANEIWGGNPAKFIRKIEV